MQAVYDCDRMSTHTVQNQTEANLKILMEIKFILPEGLQSTLTEENKKICHGLVFKAKENIYIDNRGNYTEKRSMHLMKKYSCEGCEDCYTDKECFVS